MDHAHDDPAKPPSAARVLARSPEGTRLRLVSVHGGQAMKTRLAAMGLVPGECCLVVRNRFPGPLILEIKGSRLLLGAGMAARVRVEACDAGEEGGQRRGTTKCDDPACKPHSP